ncbi:hypothetical protein [uncultured Tateyamaria sp.]|uniref:DUF7079 family protein n=1 Tax=uncultured Tateyamaria sp. TaxID=455651 RepID=UPI002615E712|nr:hypothetical protein [uncultured Tateyamaria sp.]
MTTGLSAREQVWMAMAEMFLDSDFAYMLDAPARVLAASPFDLEELDHILLHEVYPVCGWNLYAPAGVWTGFDEEDVVTKISAYRARRKPLLRLWTPMRRRNMRAMLPQWPEMRRLVAALRDPDCIPK